MTLQEHRIRIDAAIAALAADPDAGPSEERRLRALALVADATAYVRTLTDTEPRPCQVALVRAMTLAMFGTNVPAVLSQIREALDTADRLAADAAARAAQPQHTSARPTLH